MAMLHRDNRYDRSSDDVSLLTSVPPLSIEDFVRAHQSDSKSRTSNDRGRSSNNRAVRSG